MRKRLILAAFLGFTALALPAAGAQAPSSVTLRAAAHDTFDRLVFDWPRDVPFHLDRQGSSVSLVFDQEAQLRSSDSLGKLSRLKGFATHSDAKAHLVVTFFVESRASVKSFANDHSIVLDISGAAAPESPASPPEKREPSAAPVSSKPPEAEKPPVISQPSLSPSEVSPLSPVIPPSLAAPPKPQVPSANTKQKLDLSDDPTLVVSLDPHVPLRTVVYQRAGQGVILFDRKIVLSIDALAGNVPPQVELHPIDLPHNSGYRFAVPPGAFLRASLDGTAWKIFLSKSEADLPVSMGLVAQPDFALGARLLLPLPNAPEPVSMTDPVVGDELILIPLGQSAAFNARHEMADFAILPAAQGMVIKPRNEKLTVRPVSDGMEITTEGGLSLSRPADTGASQRSARWGRDAAAGTSIFDFATWKGKEGETFSATRQRLQQTIVDVPETERNRAVVELARFYFANGNAEEAAALFETLAARVPDLQAHDDFQSLVGAAQILAYRPQDGLRTLDRPGLVVQPEIELWRAVALAEQRDWKGAEEKFAAREPLLAGYPDPLFSRFSVLAVESALAVEKNQEAADWLATLSDAPHQDKIAPALSYLRGVVQAKGGHAKEAKEAWLEAAKSGDRLYRVRAELALIDLDVASGGMKPGAAAERLEALRFAWRGDDLEADILHRLAQFYSNAKNFKAALSALEQAIGLYPSSPIAAQMHQEMAQLFHDLFLTDLGNTLSPLDFLALYDQYRTLMPVGKDGEVLLQNLAERLISIDLLDQADGLLSDLAQDRLQGAQKQRALLRIGGIRLLNHKPTEALQALERLGAEPLSAEMQDEKLLLRVRALIELHRDAEGQALLKDNTSKAARMLRADLAMHAQNWTEAAKNLMELVGPPPAKDVPPSANQSDWLINAAMAYALAGDQGALDRLAIDYGKGMALSPQKEAFALLTQAEAGGPMKDLAAAQAQITQVDLLQKFLDGYRKAP